jgi:DNA-directed RNA polymerase subunit RPC12/RpoP
MFGLIEVEDNKFIYRCHKCGKESEIMTTKQIAIYSRLHQCSAGSASLPVEKLRRLASSSA